MNVFDQATASILDDLSLARHTGQPFVIGQLDTLTAFVIDIGKAHHVRGDFTGRVEAAELFNAVNARNLEVEHDLPLLGRQATNEVNEFFVGLLLKARSQHFRVLPKRACQCRPVIFTRLHFFWVGPQRGHRRTDRQRLAITVGNQPAVCRDSDVPQAAGIALTFQEIVVDHLQVDNLAGDRAYQQRQ